MDRRTFLGRGAAGLGGLLLGGCRRAPEAASGDRLAGVAERLVDHSRSIGIVDAHEHLVAETQRLGREVDAMVLLSLYVFSDLRAAGMPTRHPSQLAGNVLLDVDVPLLDRWRMVEPYLDSVRQMSSYRMVEITLADLFGVDRLDERTLVEVSERMRAENTPGLYDRILGERCGISTVLAQRHLGIELDPKPLMRPVLLLLAFYHEPGPAVLHEVTKRIGGPVPDLGSYVAALRQILEEEKDAGVVGLKIYPPPAVAPDAANAAEEFRAMVRGAPATDNLRRVLLDHLLFIARDLELPVAVHTGVWEDFRQLDPKRVIDLLRRHPEVRFDLFHLGMPYVRDSLFIARAYPNAHLNLTWTYSLSEVITARAIDEIFDVVPLNKVSAFGGDLRWAVENVYGHLELARWSVARALAERVVRGRTDEDEARWVIERWFRDNPRELYSLA